MKKKITNKAASVKDRLKRYGREQGENFNYVLRQYANERFLYRVGISRYAGNLILKGALLYKVWGVTKHRHTKDVDLLGNHLENSEDTIIGVFEEICGIEADDGIVFVVGTIQSERIREEADYEGLRIKLDGYLGKARIPLQFDICFGDVITPGVKTGEFPTLIFSNPPVIQSYPMETFIAEKFEAMVKLGIASSRMKDFYDIHYLAGNFSFDAGVLSKAIRNTFRNRGTEISQELPMVFTEDFYLNGNKRKQWNAFLRKIGEKDTGNDLREVIEVIRNFLWHPASTENPKGKWMPGEGWR